MSPFDKLFQKYRNQTKNRHIQYGTDSGEQTSVQKFGQQALQKNPNLPIFDNAQNNIAEIIDRGSVVSQFQTQTKLESETYFGSLFSGITAMPLWTNKADRVRQYRSMAQYTDCDFCLTELADDFLHQDEKGKYINLIIPDEKTHLNEDKRKVLQIQFDKFIEIFHFQDNGYNFVKKFLTDGELTFENIINPEKPELGIIGIKYLPTEYFETILDVDTGRPIGIVFDKEHMQKDLKNIISTSCLGARSIFNNMITTSAQNYSNLQKDTIPLLYPQLTYISSGEVSNDGLITYPLIEKCKQAYHQLALMQDAAVILRVTRAPERLLFNISTGGMADKVSRQKIQQFINDLKSKKIVSSNEMINGSGKGQDITEVYNPVSMLETYFFGKSNANDGTTVESVGSTADYEQIADIEFFMRKLFKQFKVPFSRFKAPENSMERDDTISYEEYSMARMIIRIQRRFAMGLKRSFITHLKLVGLWKTYRLKESDFMIDFVTPILYDLYNQQKMIGAKMDAYKAVSENDEFSKTVAMKKILRMTDEEIEENFIGLIKEKQWTAIADFYADKISEDNYPLDIKSPFRLNGVDGEKDESNAKNENGEGNEGEDNGGSDEGGESSNDTSYEEPPMPESTDNKDEGGE